MTPRFGEPPADNMPKRAATAPEENPIGERTCDPMGEAMRCIGEATRGTLPTLALRPWVLTWEGIMFIEQDKLIEPVLTFIEPCCDCIGDATCWGDRMRPGDAPFIGDVARGGKIWSDRVRMELGG
mmetsp:Transcript_90056/g.257928  ORF Transcript_90056/g.257928 Transcript_90056/m.257928 type:complete len:126 (+) Transcript_90056:517-894(+)